MNNKFNIYNIIQFCFNYVISPLFYMSIAFVFSLFYVNMCYRFGLAFVYLSCIVFFIYRIKYKRNNFDEFKKSQRFRVHVYVNTTVITIILAALLTYLYFQITLCSPIVGYAVAVIGMLYYWCGWIHPEEQKRRDQFKKGIY